MADKLAITARIEEVPILAQFTADNLTRDLPDFSSYKPAKYTPGYVTNILTQKGTVEAIVNPKKLTAELAVVTLRIMQNMEAIRPWMNRLEGYVRDAVGLTVLPKNFGIKEVRKQISEDDQEGLNGALLYLIGNINNNMGALTAAGYSGGELTTLQGLRQAIFDDNALQNQKLGARAQLVVDNRGIINALCLLLKEVWADGKLLYRLSNKTKAKDYSNAELINRIRQEELKTKIIGRVTGDDAAGLNKCKIIARPVIGKRGKTVYSKADGTFEIAGLKPGFYNLRIEKAGYQVSIVQFEAATSQITDADVLQLVR